MIEPVKSSLEDFPESVVFPKGSRVIPADFKKNSVHIHLNVPYAVKDGVELRLQIMEPVQREGENRRYPLLLYVQGSAWRKQNLGTELAQLSRFAAKGYVIAVVEYRPSDLAPFPAQVKDLKTAVRFMKEKSAFYHADPEKLAVWGDSSGGHTAVMGAFTQNLPELDDGFRAEEPLHIRAVVDYYGPTDISRMNDEPSVMDHRAPDSPEGMLIGGVEVSAHPERVRPTVPMEYLSEAIPPVLIIHGSKDRLVPFGQSAALYEALRSCGKEVQLIRLQGADHGGPPFWADKVLDIVHEFLQRHC